MSDRAEQLSPLKQALLAVEEMQRRVERLESERSEPVAVIGIGCRFPGGANGPESFWRMLMADVDAVTGIPKDRRITEGVRISNPYGAFLEHVDQFDAEFFDIAPREAKQMDPQQRLLLEVTWEALADAGLPAERLIGSQGGVFVGVCHDDYRIMQLSDLSRIDIYSGTGTGYNTLSGRISYLLDWHGPSIVMDTACSSSLVAVHLAVQSLRTQECSLAVAGGVNLILDPAMYICGSEMQLLASDGRCKAFDASGDGMGRGEGCGMVVLKRLSDAQANADNILAVIRGTAVNHDGHTNGITAPNGLAQREVILKALTNARIDPSLISCVEAHGTGTPLGDPVEMECLKEIYGQAKQGADVCWVGSVKTNIGHTEGAAGIAGLIKAVLSIQHAKVPSSLHMKRLNPHVSLHDTRIAIPMQSQSWQPRGRRRVAAVSSFGWSGTNAHVVLDEPPADDTAANVQAAVQSADSSTMKPCLIPLSGHTPAALRQVAARLDEWFSSDAASRASLEEISYTAGVRRSHYRHRAAVVGETRETVTEALRAFMNAENRLGLVRNASLPDGMRRIIFVFPGQGSQRVGMGHQLFHEAPAFRAALHACDEAVRKHAGFSLIEEIQASETDSRLGRVDVIQPCLFAIQVALSAQWRAWGVEPAAVIGQSVGEVAAAHVAGALGLDDAARIVCRRSMLVREHASGRGGMAVLGLSAEEARDALRGYEDQLAVAVSNGPASSLISGNSDALDAVLKGLEVRKIFCRRVKVDYASHSFHMDSVRPPLLATLSAIRPRAPSIPFLSTVTGSQIEGSELGAEYWVKNLRQPVLFWPTAFCMAGQGTRIFLEISPHPVLAEPIEEGLRHLGIEGAFVESLRRDQREHTALLSALGRLFALGCSIDFSKLHPGGPHRLVSLPTYPWQRKHYWLAETSPIRRANGTERTVHAILRSGSRFRSSASDAQLFWELPLGVELLPFLADHVVKRTVILPSTAYLELALATASEVSEARPVVLENISISEALVVPEKGTRTVQLVMTGDLSAGAQFKISSASGSAPTEDLWTKHCVGQVRRIQQGSEAAAQSESLTAIRERCRDPISKAEHYRRTKSRGLDYGACFQGIQALWCGNGEAIGHVLWPEELETGAGKYLVHPAVLDACLQTAFAAMPWKDDSNGPADTWLPVNIGRFRASMPLQPGVPVWAHARRVNHSRSAGSEMAVDVLVMDGTGNVLIEVRDMRLRRLDASARLAPEEWMYTVAWQQQAAAPSAQARGTWLLFADNGNVEKTLRTLLEHQGAHCVSAIPGTEFRVMSPRLFMINPVQPADFQRLLSEIERSADMPLRSVVHLWSLDITSSVITTGEMLEKASDLGCISALHCVQALAGREGAPPRLWLVTAGAQPVRSEKDVTAPAPTALWGLARTIAAEYPELRCTRVDIDAHKPALDAEILFNVLLCEDDEDEMALRDGVRFVPRVVPFPTDGMLPSSERRSATVAVPARDPFQLGIRRRGSLDGLALHRSDRREPGPGEVEIAVRAAGLNFRDVLKVLGEHPGLPDGPVSLGDECAGVVTSVGEGVAKLKVGDEVVAVLAEQSFASFVTIRADRVIPKPRQLRFEDAATIGSAYLTAWYALYDQARLRSGERVLIHAAAGGVGLAALQIARHLGASLYATAGSPEKRAFLRSLGVEHVFDSRSLAFVQGIQESTHGEGIDVVLNALAGEFIPASLSLLRPFGRFIELGKKDVYGNTMIGLEPFKDNLSLHVVDLVQLGRDRPQRFAEMLRAVMDRFEDGQFTPICRHVFPISQAQEAFRLMLHARHTGKIALSFEVPEVQVLEQEVKSVRFRPDATYLITGGLGGLGLVVARWLLEHGARHLVLMGRSAPTEEVWQRVLALGEQGAKVHVILGDVSKSSDVQRVLDTIDTTMPALRGIVHTAGILRDATLTRMDRANFLAAMAPKVQGAFHLHLATQHRMLDHFVLFSSAAGVLGASGQGNYAAANAFLDGLAWHRRALGLPAVSIDWGSWSEVGLAAADVNRQKRLVGMGISPMSPSEALDALGRVLQQNKAQVMVARLDPRRWAASTAGRAKTLLSALIGAESSPASPGADPSAIRDKLLAAEPSSRAALLAAHLKVELAKVLQLDASEIRENVPFRNMGMDSLTSLDFRNRVEATLEVRLSAATVWSYPTISELVAHLAGKLDLAVANQAPPADSPMPARDHAPASLEQLSGDELVARLDQMLSELDIPKARMP